MTSPSTKKRRSDPGQPEKRHLPGNNLNLTRLQKFLAGAGVCSRRQAEKMILEGRVKVDGRTVTALGTKIDAGRQQVMLDGKRIRPGTDHLYLMMNKPKGILTTLRDPYGRPTISDLLRGVPRVYPVGRLDMDSEGLLLLTNHGELAYRLLHPSFKVPKKYLVTVKGLPSGKDLERLRSGVEIEGGFRTGPCLIKLLSKRKERAVLEVILKEGRKRQIRLMFKTAGHFVLRLKRTEMGTLRLGKLKAGSYRELTPEEVKDLKKAAGL